MKTSSSAGIVMLSCSSTLMPADAPQALVEVKNAEPKQRPTPRGAFWLRFGAAHFLSYPPAFAAAFAGVPLAMVVRHDAVLSAPCEQVAQRLVLEVCIGAGVLVYVLVHLYALPWSLAAAAAARGEPEARMRRKRGRTFFLAATLATAAFAVIGTLLGWIWLLG